MTANDLERPTVVESYEEVIPHIPNIAAACCSPSPVAAELGFVPGVRPPLVPRVHRSPSTRTPQSCAAYPAPGSLLARRGHSGMLIFANSIS